MPAITGTVQKQGKPLGGVYVRLVGPSGEFVAEEYTQDDGNFSFHVVDGTWRLEARAAASVTAIEEVHVAGGDAKIALDLRSA